MEGYKLTGDEQLIFLFINSTGKRVEFYANVDGAMTSKVTVKPFAAAAKEPVATPGNADKPQPGPGGNAGNTPGTTAPEEAGPGVEEETTAPEEAGPGVNDETEEAPTEAPAEEPTENPTEAPTEAPTETPTENPTEAPTEAPTETPTENPTEAPTETPTETPTENPTEAPTEAPTETPTENPTEAPTEAPTETPTENPTEAPTETPTETPTENPTEAPTETPTETPTEAPAEAPTEAPAAPAADGESLAVGISRKEVTLVANPVDGAAEAAEETEATQESETPEETEQADIVIEIEPETTAASDETEPEIEITFPDETTEAEEETTAAAEEDYEIPEDKNYFEGIELIDDVTPEEELAEAPEESKDADGRIYGEAEVDGNARARAFVTTLNGMNIDITGGIVLPENKEYTLNVTHILSTEIGRFKDETELTIHSEDFTDGSYNVLQHAYDREGIELSDKNITIEEAEFDENGVGFATIEYHVIDGWKAVLNRDWAFRSIYIGTFNDVTIVPVTQRAVTFHYIYENGLVAKVSETIMADKDENGEYPFEQEVDVPNGYTMTVEEDGYEVNGNIISGKLSKERTELTVVFVAGDVTYTVRHIYPALEASGKEDEVVDREATGKAGELSEAAAEPKPGFLPRPIIQKEITEGLVLEVNYVRETYQLNYDTRGGSYIKAKTGLYESELDAFTVETKEDKVPNGKVEQGDLKCDRSGFGHWRHNDNCYEWIPQYDTIITTTYDPTPAKAGYTFDGWYLNEACTEPANPKIQLTGNVTLYAKWSAETVRYTVVYMQEKLNSDNTSYYAFAEAAVKEALTGSTVQGEGDKTYQHYEFSRATSDTVRADGSTIVFAYYNLKEYKFTFNLKDSKATLVMDGKTYRNKEYTLNVKLGQNIASVWPTSDHVTTSTKAGGKTQKFHKWDPDQYTTDWLTKRFEVTPDMIGKGDVTLTAVWSTSLIKRQVNYWLQDTVGNDYTISEVYSQTLHQPEREGLTNKDIYGFTKQENAPSDYPDEEVGNTYNFYYKRNVSDIEYRYMDTKLNSKSVRFGADISGSTYNYMPERPNGVDSDYTFGGWYKDDPQGLGDPYVFGTMPDGGLLLYAKWTPPTKTVTLDFMDEVTENDTITVPKHQTAQIPVPDREGYLFAGWYLNEDCTGEEFDVNAPVTEDVTIYAKWEENRYSSYKVRFVIKDQTADDGYLDIDNPVTGTDVVGTAVQVKAKVFTTGIYTTYAVDKPVITFTITNAASENEYMFIYSAPADLKYKVQYTYNGVVQYRENNGGFINAEAARFSVSPTEAAANYLRENGYRINENFIKAVLTSDNEANMVTFTLSPMPYTITYEGLDGITGWEKTSGTANPNRAIYTMLDNSFHLVNPVKSGHIFTGWTTTAKTEENSAEHDPMNVYIEKGTKGNLTFTATWEPLRSIKVAAGSKSKPYDGTALTDSSCSLVEGTLIEGDQLEAKAAGSATDVADSVTGNNKVASVKIIRGGVDVTHYYNIGTVPGTLTITKRNVTLTSADDSKEYDGTPLTNGTVSVSGDGFIKGEGATWSVTGSRTEVGTSDNKFTYTLNAGTKAGNYNITPAYGTLTVTPVAAEIIITAASDSKTYDGTPLTNGNVTYTKNVLVEGDVLTAVVEGSQTDAGTGANVVTSYKVTRDGKDVTDHYTFGNSINGALTVKARNVILVSGSGTKEYDKTPLTNSTVKEEGSRFVAGEGATYNVTGSQTEVGTSKNTFTYALKEGTKAQNYNITTREGDLTVTAKEDPIVIRAASATRLYDGTPLTNANYTYTDGILVDGDELTATVEGSQTDAGTSANTVTDYRVMRGEKDVTHYYTFGNSIEGTLTVEARKVTLTSADDSKEYDGTPLTNDTVTESGDGFIEGEGADYNVTGSQTDAGTSRNTFSYTLKTGTKAQNYLITQNEGELRVTAIREQIVIKAASGSKTYDGSPLTNAGYDYPENILAEGDILTATVEGSQTDAGTGVNKVTSFQVMRGSTDVTRNYTFGKSIDGTLTVGKRKVTLTSATDEKFYDGTPLTNSTVTPGGDGFVSGEGATYDVTGSRTDVGEAPNLFTYNLNQGTKAGNYEIERKFGTLKVKAIAANIIITADSASKTYDGIPLTDVGYTYTDNILVEGDTLTAVVEGSQTNAGTGANVVTSYKVMRGEKDVTANYTFGDSIDGTLTVTARKVTMVSASDSKEYDGTPLTNSTVTEEGDGFIEGEGAAYNVTGSRTDAGTSTNTFTYELTAGTKAQNYIITRREGKLTVTAKNSPIVITAASDSKTYDGTPLTNSGYGFTQGILEAEDILTAVVTGSQTNAGTGRNEVTSYKVMRGEADVTDNYTFSSPVDGKLTVNRRPVEISVGSDGKRYGDADPAFAPATIGAYIGTDLDAIDLTVIRSDAGNDELGTHSGVLVTGKTEAQYNAQYPNYLFTVIPADFTINENTGSMTAMADPVTEVYDGNKYGINVSVLIDGEPTKSAAVRFLDADGDYSLEASPEYKDAGSYTVRYEVTKYGYGTYYGEADVTITKRPVIITANDAQKYYGKADPAFTADGGKGEIGNPDSGVVAGERLAYTVTRPGAGTEETPGTYPNALEVTSDPAEGANRNYEIRTVPANFTIHLDALRVTKTVVTPPANGSYYTVGETVAFNIRVENTGTTTLGNITVTDGLEGAWLEGLTSGESMTVANLAAGSEVNLKAYYQIKESDLGRTDLKNIATAEADSTDPGNPGDKPKDEDETETLEVDKPNPGLGIEKSVTNELPDGEGFAAGDEIRFTIAVYNNGNTTVQNVIVKDTLIGAEILPDNNYVIDQGNAVIGEMLPGTSVNVYARYIVKAEDVGREDFKNTATAGNKDTETGGETPLIPTKGLKVEKSVTNKGTAENGLFTTDDTVTFDIKVTNTGTEAINNIRVDDRLEGATILTGAGYTVANNQATIPSLAAGASITVKAEYKVKEADLRKERFTNVATAAFTSEGGEKEVPGETPEIPTVDPERSWKIAKTLTNLPARGYFRINEIAEFSIRVENTGKQTLNDIVIKDELAGATLTATNGYSVNADGTVTIGRLEAGQSVEIGASYRITSADVGNRRFENIATATIGTEVETARVETRTGTSGGGGGGGGGGDNGGPNPNTPGTPGGPGVPTTTIDPSPVPLAMAPEEENLVLIDDGEVPLAGLPKTGDPADSLPWMLLFSSMALVVHTILGRKKEDEN